MSSATFEPSIPASKWPQIHTLDHTATRISTCSYIVTTIKSYQNKPLERVIHYLKLPVTFSYNILTKQNTWVV
jgi:hypothetical protein